MTGIWLLSYLALWALTVMLLVIVLVLARQIGLLHTRIPPVGARMGNPGPAVGETVPQASGVAIDGRRVSIGGKRPRQTLLVFVTPTCESCHHLAPSLRSIARSERSRLETILVCPRGEAAEAERFVRQLKLESLPLILSSELAELYRVATTPYALLVDEAGVLSAKGLVNHIEHLESLLTALDMGHPSEESRQMAGESGRGPVATLDTTPGRASRPRAKGRAGNGEQ